MISCEAAAVMSRSSVKLETLCGVKDKNIHRLMQYADQLHVKLKVLRYMEVLL